jgi:hypothetical protein
MIRSKEMTKSELMDFVAGLIMIGGVAIFAMTPMFWSLIRAGSNYFFG